MDAKAHLPFFLIFFFLRQAQDTVRRPNRNPQHWEPSSSEEPRQPEIPLDIAKFTIDEVARRMSLLGRVTLQK